MCVQHRANQCAVAEGFISNVPRLICALITKHAFSDTLGLTCMERALYLPPNIDNVSPLIIDHVLVSPPTVRKDSISGESSNRFGDPEDESWRDLIHLRPDTLCPLSLTMLHQSLETRPSITVLC